MKDRTSNEKGHERKQSCLHEHKHSDNIYLGCGFISCSPSQFVMPPELILYPIVRANEGFDSTNNVSPSPRKRSKTSSSATTTNSDFSSALYLPQQHRSSGRSAARATGRGKRIYASSSESLPELSTAHAAAEALHSLKQLSSSGRSASRTTRTVKRTYASSSESDSDSELSLPPQRKSSRRSATRAANKKGF